MPKVSIIMPLFNKGPYVRDALSSILRQTFCDFELIIIDDKSVDDTVGIVREFHDERIRLYANSRNMGQADTLNNGIEKATGEYITFAHGDDIWLETFLSTHLAMLEAHWDINISCARAHSIDDDGNVTYATPNDLEPPYTIVAHDEMVIKLLKGSCITTPTVFLRNGSFPFFNNRFVFSCDWDLWLRIAALGNDFLFLNQPLIYYRYSSNNVTSIAMRTGVNIIEDYLTLSSFFENWPQYVDRRPKSLRRLSMRTLRLSREVRSQETIFLYQKLALVFNPLNILNPVFMVYVIAGLSFGHRGMTMLKSVSKKVSAGLRRTRNSLSVQAANRL